MMEPAAAGHDVPRAYLRLGGASLARHQLALALAAGCERIACLARALDPELIALQHEAEHAGARFHMISGGRALSGLVTANDELLVLAEGVVPAPLEALNLVSQAHTVLVLPAETAVPAGFERIDLNHAGAGVMLIPGRLAERLNDLPPDAEPVSSLLRIALQAGIKQRLVPQALSGSGKWLLVRDEDQAHAAEDQWMARQTAGLGQSPGIAFSVWAVRRFGSALLHAGSGSRTLGVIALALVLLAAGASWFGWTVAGLALCLAAWLVHGSAAIIAGVQNEALGLRLGLLARHGPFGWLVDGVIGLLLYAGIPGVPGEQMWQKAFAPIVLIGLLRIVPRLVPRRLGNWLEDRMLACLILGGFAAAGVLAMAIPGLAIVLIVAGIVLVRQSTGITRA